MGYVIGNGVVHLELTTVEVHSTSTALLQCINNWFIALDHGLLVGVLFLDMPKFDTVDHGQLVRKLSTLDVSPQGLEWMESYLRHHTQSTLWGVQYQIPLLFLLVSLRALSWVPHISLCS